MPYRAKYRLLLAGVLMGTPILVGCMVIMPLMMAPAVGHEFANSPEQTMGGLIQKGLRELDANKGKYDRILLRRVETDDPTLSEQKLRQMIVEQAAVLDLKILESRAGEGPSNLDVESVRGSGDRAILDSGLFRADSVDILHLKLTDYLTGQLVWERRLVGPVGKGRTGPGH